MSRDVQLAVYYPGKALPLRSGIRFGKSTGPSDQRRLLRFPGPPRWAEMRTKTEVLEGELGTALLVAQGFDFDQVDISS